MGNSFRLITLASTTVALSALVACGSTPMRTNMPTTSYPSTSYPGSSSTGSSTSTAPGYVEYGRVTSVELVHSQNSGQGSGAGAVIGGIAGGVLGHQIGGGTGRDLATIAGVAGGAIAGNSIEKNSQMQGRDFYRISVQADNGIVRSYDLSSSGELRVGDRVRIDNGQLYRN